MPGLVTALEVASGRRSDAGEVPAPLLAWARSLVHLRRSLLEREPCPAPVLRRAEGLLASRRPGLAALLRLVFDSAAAAPASPALRGRGQRRLLRYQGEDVALDLALHVSAAGDRVVEVALDPPGRGVEARLERGGRQRRIPPDPAGALRVRLPAGRGPCRIVLVREGRVVAQTPPLPWTPTPPPGPPPGPPPTPPPAPGPP